jgi:hypothetical protein
MNYRDEFELRARRHIQLFQVVVEQINIELDVTQIHEWQIIRHDLSKFSEAEFDIYARKIMRLEVSDEEWQSALQHHYRHNPHHWNSWLVHGRPLPMEPWYVSEMVADWLASSRQYTGSWNMVDWLCDNLGGLRPKIKLHVETRQLVDQILRRIGYLTDLDNCGMYGWSGSDEGEWFHRRLETMALAILPPGGEASE